MKNLSSLCFLLFFSVIVIVYANAGDFLYEIDGNSVYITGYQGEAKNVVVPAKIAGKNVTRIDYDAFRDAAITSVSLPSTVTIIEEDAFTNCGAESFSVDAKNPELSTQDGVLFNKNKTTLVAYPNGKRTTDYSLPNTVTGMHEDAVKYCTYLKTFTLPAAFKYFQVDDDVNDEVDAFGSCFALTDIKVASGNTSFTSVNGVLFNKSKTELWCYPMGKPERTYSIPNGTKIIKESSFDAYVEPTGWDEVEGYWWEGDNGDAGSALRTVNFPASITKIEDEAFGYSRVRNFVFLGKPPKIGEYAVLFNEYIQDEQVVKAYAGNGWENIAYFDGLRVEIVAVMAKFDIRGCEEIVSGQECEYYAEAIYSDGVSSPVDATWSITSGGAYASVNADGVVTAKNVTKEQTVTLNASYTEGTVSKSASLKITIVPITLEELYIDGASSVVSGQQERYTATAFYSDWSEKNVTPIWSIISGINYASINAQGFLTATDEIYVQQSVVLHADYQENGVSKTTEKTITIVAKQPKLTGLEISTESKAITIPAGTSASLTAAAIYNVGPNKTVLPNEWRIIHDAANIASLDGDHVHIASNLATVSVITIQATYYENGVSVTSTLDLVAMPIVYTGQNFEYTYVLKKGWNLISIVLDLNDLSEQSLLQDFSIFTFDSKNGHYVIPKKLEPGASVWLFTEKNTPLVVQGTPMGIALQ